MGKLIRKFHIASPYHIGAYESWLTDMADRGLILKKMGRYFVWFEKSEPSRMEYRIDIARKTSSTERKNIYEQSGWKYVTSIKHVHFFSAPAGTQTTEIPADVKEQGIVLSEVIKSIGIALTILLLCTLFYIGISCVSIFLFGTPYLNLIENDTSWIFLAFSFILMLYIYSKQLIDVLAIKKALIKGKKIDHHESWKNPKIFNITIALLAATIIVFEIISVSVMASNIYAIATGTRNFYISKKTELPVLLLRDMEDLDDAYYRNIESDAKEAGAVADLPAGTIIYSGFGSSNHSMMAYHQYNTTESAYDNERLYNDHLSTEYYELTFAWMADGILRELIQHEMESYSKDYYPDIATQKLDHDGLDQVYMLQTDRSICFFTSKDNIVVSMEYSGDKSADELLDALVVVMN